MEKKINPHYLFVKKIILVMIKNKNLKISKLWKQLLNGNCFIITVRN